MFSLKLCKNTKKTALERKIMRIFALIKSLSLIFKRKRYMRKRISPHFTPIARLCISFTAGIVMAYFCHSLIDTLYWLIATIMSYGLCLLPSLHKQSKGIQQVTQQCVGIYFCLFSLGGFLTSHEIDDKQNSHTPVVTYKDLSVTERAEWTVKEYCIRIEQHLKDLKIKDQEFAIITAMTLGDKTALSSKTKDIYSISGASHVLAVSGLHIGIIFQLFFLSLGGRKKRSPYAIALSLSAIWMYVLFIGMPASAIRSATMISICCSALLFHRKALSFNNLSCAFLIMLFSHPLYLFDISFQMSFLAISFILLLAPIFQASVHTRHRLTRWLWNMTSLSLAAQIGTMPLIAFYFGRISCYALLTSFIAIPAATLILYLSALLLLLALLSGVSFLSFITTWLIKVTVSCLLSITQACNTALELSTLLPNASIDGIKINIPQLCLIYFGIIAGYVFIRKLPLFHSR